MELNLPPLSTISQISNVAFEDGQRVLSYLERDPQSPEAVKRTDLLESESERYQSSGQVVCRWVHLYKAKQGGENKERALKLTAENLFLTLADPMTEPSAENTRLLQFLGLMMERKRLIKPRGRTADGLRQRYEHVRTKQMIELPIEELTPEFFMQVREQLSILVGVPKSEGPAPENTAKPVQEEGSAAEAPQASAPTPSAEE